MSSSLEFVRYVCEQISGAGDITYKKMFGEYGVYCDGKFIGVICDDQFFVKKTDAGSALYPECPEAAPYEGAKPHLLMERLEDRELMIPFIRATFLALPQPKPRKKKQPPKIE